MTMPQIVWLMQIFHERCTVQNCDDYWCEHRTENSTNCNKCLKKDASENQSGVRFIENLRLLQKMKTEDKSNIMQQSR